VKPRIHGLSFTAEHPINRVSDGSAGLGSETGYFLSDGTAFSFTNSQEATDPPAPPSTLSAVVPNDFDGNRASDLVWQSTDSSVTVWRVNGTQAAGNADLADPGPSWHIRATGDFWRDWLFSISAKYCSTLARTSGGGLPSAALSK
jgi:hypothetical protein